MDYLLISNYLGTIAFAVSGIIMGMRRDLDIMGIFIMALLTSSGGGIFRDILLNRVPVFLETQYIYAAVIAIIIVFKFLRKKDIIDHLEGTFIFRASDTIGLVAFAISGAQAAMAAGLEFFTVILISFISAVGGGILRDTLVNEVPAILRSGFYGSVAVIVGLGMYGLNYIGMAENTYIPIVFVTGLLVRFLAIRYTLQLPKI